MENKVIEREVDEFNPEDLDNIKAGLSNDSLAVSEALKHPELFRQAAVDKLIEEMCAQEEEKTNSTGGMKM